MEVCAAPPPPPGSRAFTELVRRLGGGAKQAVEDVFTEEEIKEAVLVGACALARSMQKLGISKSGQLTDVTLVVRCRRDSKSPAFCSSSSHPLPPSCRCAAAAANNSITSSSSFPSSSSSVATPPPARPVASSSLRIAAHRAILSAWSTKFRALFLSPALKDLEFGGKVTIPVDNPRVFREFIRFMYIPLARLSRENVFEMLRLGHQWRVKELESQCIRFVQKTLSVREIAHDWAFADAMKLSGLAETCAEFAAKNVRQCHRDLPLKHLAKVLVRDDLGVADETEVFEIVMQRTRRLLKEEEKNKTLSGAAKTGTMNGSPNSVVDRKKTSHGDVVMLLSALRVRSLPEGYLEEVVLRQKELQANNGKLHPEFMEVLLMSPRRLQGGRQGYTGPGLSLRSATRLGLRFTSTEDIKANVVVRVLASVPEVARFCNEKPPGATSGAVGFQPSMAKFCGKLVRVKSISVGPAAARIHGYMFPYTCLERVPAVELEEYHRRLRNRVLREGELVDVLDREDDWLPARVEKVKEDRKTGRMEALVSLIEFPSKWDEWIPASSPRIAELHEYSRRRGEVLTVVKPIIQADLETRQRRNNPAHRRTSLTDLIVEDLNGSGSPLPPILRRYLRFILLHGKDSKYFWTDEVELQLRNHFGISRLMISDKDWKTVCVHKRLRHISAMMMDSKGRGRRTQRDASRLNSDEPKWPPISVRVDNLTPDSLHEKVLMGQEVSLRRIAQLSNIRVAARIEHPRFGAAQEVEGGEAKFFAERAHVASGELSEYDSTGIHILPKVLEMWDGERDELKLTKGLSMLDTILMQVLLHTTEIHERRQALIEASPVLIATGSEDKSINGTYRIDRYQHMRPSYINEYGTQIWFDESHWRAKAKGYDPKKAMKSGKKSKRRDQAFKPKVKPGDPCPICYKEMNEGNAQLAFCAVKCGGGFHAECIRVWAKTRDEDGKVVSCPLCRADWSGTSFEFENTSGFFPPLGTWPGSGSPTLSTLNARQTNSNGDCKNAKDPAGCDDWAEFKKRADPDEQIPSADHKQFDLAKTMVPNSQSDSESLEAQLKHLYSSVEGENKVHGTFEELKRMGFGTRAIAAEVNQVGMDLDAIVKRLVFTVGSHEEEQKDSDEEDESKMTELLPALLRALES